MHVNKPLNIRFVSPIALRSRNDYIITPDAPRSLTRNEYLSNLVEAACDNVDVYIDSKAILNVLRKQRTCMYPTEDEINELITKYSLGAKLRCSICSIDMGQYAEVNVDRMCGNCM